MALRKTEVTPLLTHWSYCSTKPSICCNHMLMMTYDKWHCCSLEADRWYTYLPHLTIILTKTSRGAGSTSPPRWQFMWRGVSSDLTHYNDVIMCAIASQITSLTIVYSIVYSDRRRSKKTSKLCVTGLCAGNSPGTGEFPAPMPSNAENVSIWWRHHASVVITDYYVISLYSTTCLRQTCNKLRITFFTPCAPPFCGCSRIRVYFPLLVFSLLIS